MTIATEHGGVNDAADDASAGVPVRLNRQALADRTGTQLQAPPVRIVHVGLGAFHRAHQAWYTANAADAADWGIAAFTGRSSTVADQLAPQDGLYTLIERSDAGDSVTVIPSVVEAVDGANLGRFVELIAAPATSIVTLTITEAGYRLASDGQPDLSDEIMAADISWLRGALAAAELPDPDADADAAPRGTLGRLLLGLDARRRSGAGPITIVPCDNIPSNGEFVEQGLIALAALVNGPTAVWLRANVSFVSTSVDRITPRTTDEDVSTSARISGWLDAAPVVTEPFRDWVLSGSFPAGRPAWESAGARFVTDIEPFERRKLWLLNGAHSLLAYAGTLLGYETVSAAIGDPRLRTWVEELWDEAVRNLPVEGLELDAYRRDLRARFENSRIEHRLAQIATDGLTKLRVRVVDVARAERSAGRDAAGCARAIGAWVALLLSGRRLADAQFAAVAAALGDGDRGAVQRLVALLDDALAQDADFVASVESAVDSFA